jgi:hypothetical protein
MPTRSVRCSLAIGAAAILLVSLAKTGESQRAIPEWSLGAAPLLVLGERGVAGEEFLRIRAVFRLSNGVVAVLNGGTNEIRLFDEHGRSIRSFGGTGSGPGEFRFISWAGRSGDTVFVFDHSLGRISSVVLGGEPRLLGTWPVTARGTRGPLSVGGRLSDGRWLVATGVTPGWDGPPGVHRLPQSVGVISADGTGDVSWFGEYPSAAFFVFSPTGNIQQATFGAIAFSPWFYSAASGQHVWLGESGADSLVHMDFVRGTRATVRLPLPRRTPPAALVAARRAREMLAATNERSRAFTDAKWSSTYLPPSLPFFEALVPGPGGEIWIQDYAGVPTDSARYLVVGPDMVARAWVRVPSGLRVHEVGVDYVLGMHEDGDGVESVRLYRLSRR